MIEFYPTKLFRTYPTKIGFGFDLKEEFGIETLDKLEEYLSKTMDKKYAMWMPSEYAVAYWLMEHFGFPDVVPNRDVYWTDLDYENDRYCNFHVKAVEMNAATISGLVTLKRNTPEPLLANDKVIENDVIIFVSYDPLGKGVIIHGTVPAKIAKNLWKDPFMTKLVGQKKVINFDDVLALPDVVDLSTYAFVASTSEPKKQQKEKRELSIGKLLGKK